MFKNAVKHIAGPAWDKYIYRSLLFLAFSLNVSTAAGSVALALSAALVLAKLRAARAAFACDRKFLYAFGLFFLVLAFSSLTGVNAPDSARRTFSLFCRSGPFFLLAAFACGREKAVKIFLAAAAGLLCTDIYVIASFGGGKASGLFKSPMSLAGLLQLMLPVLAAAAVSGGRAAFKRRAFCGAVFVLSAAALFYNGIFGAWVAVLFSLALYFFLRRKKAQAICLSLCVTAAAIGGVYAFAPAARERMDAIAAGRDPSMLERFCLWESAANMLKDYPLLGVGPGNFGRLYAARYILPDAKEPCLKHAHNDFLQMAAETGVMGLAAFIYLFYVILRLNLARYRQEKENFLALGAFLATAGFLAHGLTEFNFGNSAVTRLFWLLLGLSQAARGEEKGAAGKAPLPPPPEKVRHILLIKLMHFGDVLLATPVLSTLKMNYPHALVDVLVYGGTDDVLAANGAANNIWRVDRGLKRKGLKAQIAGEKALFDKVRSTRYDIIINLSDRWRGGLYCRLLKPAFSIGFNEGRRSRLLWGACHAVLVDRINHGEQHTVLNDLSVLAPLRLKQRSEEVVMAYRPADLEHFETISRRENLGGYVLIQPTARWAFKTWSTAGFSQLIDYLNARGQTVVLTAGKAENEIAMVKEIIAGCAEGAKIVNLAGQLTLTQLAVFIEKAELFLGVDSVPMHIAAALKTPMVVLFGPSNLKQWYPWQAEHTLLWAGDYRSLPRVGEVDTNTNERYLYAIPAKDVIEAVACRLDKGRT
ncbi:MAG: putative lipopolysaccharide heptosyltransferase III [Acidaminococcales bacterium]|nr:putative lipopolysaccharide heptosyltransferase III [Acidaminococcales bacterium]